MSKIVGELNAEMMREVKSNKAWRLECEQLRAEINEQARLLGVSAEKELALRAENERLKAELAEAKKYAEWCRTQLIDVVRKLTPEFDAARKGK